MTVLIKLGVSKLATTKNQSEKWNSYGLCKSMKCRFVPTLMLIVYVNIAYQGLYIKSAKKEAQLK